MTVRTFVFELLAVFSLSAFAGVRPSSPFFGSLRVAPRPAGLGRVRCKVPTPKGPVSVDLRFSGGEAKGFLDVPSGLPGEFVWRGEVRPLLPGRNTVDTAGGRR